MQFTITITGEQRELAESLAILKAIMGEQIGGGSVTANVTPPPAPTAQVPGPGSDQQPSAPVAPPAQPQPQQQAPAPPVVPTTEQSYSQEQLAVAATQLMDAGKQAELINLLQSFGVQALTALPKEKYGAFATALRQMGAKI